MSRLMAAPAFFAWTLLSASAFAQPAEPPAGSHPFDPEIERAEARIATMRREIQDYTCIFTKRERVEGKLMPYEQMVLRIRHNPFSVYMYWLAPKEVRGQQVVYIEGRNNGKMLAQPIGLLGKAGPYSLKVDGPIAMNGQRYQITTSGMLNMIEQLVVEAKGERKYGETTVKYYRGARVEDRVCTVTEVTHPQRPHFQYYMARIYVDDELQLPVRLETYLWPAKPGDQPPVLEEYTYTKIKLNNGFTDADFQIRKAN